MEYIKLRGAKTHNLKNIDVTIPRNKLVVITGLSGSGKSSLAFDTLYAEGQRRYVESLSTYARQFLSMMEKPDVDHIEGLSPAISIEQKSTNHNPRSTVGTITEVYDYMRLLFARIGEPRCPRHNVTLAAQTISQMVDQILSLPVDTKIMLLAPVIRERKGEHLAVINNLKSQGYIRSRVDGDIYELDDMPSLDKKKKHTIEVVVDRLKVRDDIQLRIAESIETIISLSGGLVKVSFVDGNQEDMVFSSQYACPECGYSIDDLEPKLFSFNNPAGACPSCDGLGVCQFIDPDLVIQNSDLTLSEGVIRGWDRRSVYYFQMLKSLAKHYNFSLDISFEDLTDQQKNLILYGSNNEVIQFSYLNDKGDVYLKKHSFEGIIPNFERRLLATESMSVREDLMKYQTSKSCVACKGTRLREEARNVFIDDNALTDLIKLPVEKTLIYFQELKLDGKRGEIGSTIIREVYERLSFLVDVGLNYLSLDRSADTLSGGEAQRIRLASQIGAGLVGVMYILDEPSIGLHQRDNARLLKTLDHLRDIGNTVIVVEHDEDAILSADHVIDIGPGAGVHGGRIIAQGTPQDIKETPGSITGEYLSGKKKIDIPQKRCIPNTKKILNLKGCSGNNLKDIDANIPVGLMTCITGVSGSGKSTLINGTLYPICSHKLNGAKIKMSAPYKSILGLEYFDKCIDINQSPIGRTPRSNPSTYTGLFTAIRELFSNTKEARSRGYKVGRFSFNVKGGRCEACQGDGVIKVGMHFLADIYVSCDICKGKRYNRETLQITYKNKSIDDVLNMTIEEAVVFFDVIPALKRKLETLIDVGLSYIKLGQNAVTLSGGEAQRIKLAKELSKRDTGNTLYILDEPTTGLHFADIKLLLGVLHKLRDQGNTVIIIEHNLDVIKTADWLIDLGPEGGIGGGKIIAQGTPETVANNKSSYTGQFLRKLIF